MLFVFCQVINELVTKILIAAYLPNYLKDSSSYLNILVFLTAAFMHIVCEGGVSRV